MQSSAKWANDPRRLDDIASRRTLTVNAELKHSPFGRRRRDRFRFYLETDRYRLRLVLFGSRPARFHGGPAFITRLARNARGILLAYRGAIILMRRRGPGRSRGRPVLVARLARNAGAGVLRTRD